MSTSATVTLAKLVSTASGTRASSVASSSAEKPKGLCRKRAITEMYMPNLNVQSPEFCVTFSMMASSSVVSRQVANEGRLSSSIFYTATEDNKRIQDYMAS